MTTTKTTTTKTTKTKPYKHIKAKTKTKTKTAINAAPAEGCSHPGTINCRHYLWLPAADE